MVSIAKALAQVKDDYRELLTAESILGICRQVGQGFRQRLLGPVETVHLFLVQILYGNTAISNLRHKAGFAFSESAYCKARQRLRQEVLAGLLETVTGTLRRAGRAVGRWHGHRVFHIDGSSFSMPDEPELAEHFGYPGGQKSGCGFPTAHLLAMFDAATGFLIEVLAAAWRTHDLSRAWLMHPKLSGGDVLIGDRAFCSYAHLALLIGRNLHGLFRVHQRMIVNFRPGRRHEQLCRGDWAVRGLPRSRWIKKLGYWDQLVEWFKPDSCPKWMDAASYAALPESIVLREFRYRVGRPGFRVREVTGVTTLLDAACYPLEELAELYLARWRVEVNLRDLKVTLGLEVLKCKSVAGVMKELTMFALVYNLVRAVMVQAAEGQGVRADRVSFVDALRWLRQALWQDVPLRLKVNPLRPGRFHPRVRKRRAKGYPLMRKPRWKLLQELERKRVGA